MNKNLGVQIIIFILTILFLSVVIPNNTQATPPIIQKTIIVDISGNGDYTSIKDAISNAEITDIIEIKNGIYNEHDIKINKKISIVGEDPANTIINCSGNTAFTLASAYVDITNIQLINTGEFAITTLPESINCTITNCIINTLNSGVALDIRSSYNTVSDCNLIGFDNGKQGVKIHGSYNIVKNSDIQDFSNGVLIILNSNDNQILSCNIVNNENAIDIRANSKNNIITGCNIYSNLQSIKIWDNSNNNFVYLNNFWKNDIGAIDENNNSWDKGAKGNYWDRYRGIDTNGDGIGDTPYTISANAKDRYPLISSILPDIVTYPSNIKITTSKSDTTPTFTWTSSIYSKGIKGYYVKIDNDAEIFIGNVNTWTTIKTQSNGMHKFYIRAESTDNKTSNYSAITFQIDTTIIDTDDDGWSDQEESQYGTDPNNPDNYPEDTDNDHIPDSIDTDDDGDGYSDEMELSYGTDPKDIDSYPTDTDKDGIPNDNSPDNKYIGDEDDDDDGLSDLIESEIGSNPANPQDVNKIFIVGNLYYLVDLTQNGIYDVLYNPINEKTTAVEKQNNAYLIDLNGDNEWDYIYKISDGSVSSYSKEQQLSVFIWVLLILTIIIPVLTIIYLYVRRKSVVPKQIKRPQRIIEKPLNKRTKNIPTFEKKDTIEMIGQTKTLLQQIQQDVEVYMEKLKEIEEQFMVPIMEEEKPSKTKDVHELELNVDKILSEFEKKEKK